MKRVFKILLQILACFSLGIAAAGLVLVNFELFLSLLDGSVWYFAVIGVAALIAADCLAEIIQIDKRLEHLERWRAKP